MRRAGLRISGGVTDRPALFDPPGLTTEGACTRRPPPPGCATGVGELYRVFWVAAEAVRWGAWAAALPMVAGALPPWSRVFCGAGSARYAVKKL